MPKKALFLTDMEGVLISSKAPEKEGRKYMVAARTVSGKKYVTKDNVQKLKKLNEVADIVPMTKLAARQCNAVSLCVPTPMSLVESGAILLNWTKPDIEWRNSTAEVLFESSQILYEGKRLLEKKGYVKNGDNEFTIDYIGTLDIEADTKELAFIMGEKFKVFNIGGSRIYAYHRQLSRREMVKRFLNTHQYETVIMATAPFTGWLPDFGETISATGQKAKYEYNRNYDNDPHTFASFALDTAIQLIYGIK